MYLSPHEGEPPTGDLHPMNSRPCRAYTTSWSPTLAKLARLTWSVRQHEPASVVRDSAMDRITKSLLDEFSREHDLLKLPEDKRFEHFSCYLTVGRFLSEHFDTSDIVTGSSADIGIDGIAIIINGSLVANADLVTEYADRDGYLDVL